MENLTVTCKREKETMNNPPNEFIQIGGKAKTGNDSKGTNAT